MKKVIQSVGLAVTTLYLGAIGVFAQETTEAQISLGFSVPGFSAILGFAIRLFFTVAGLAALFFLLIGAFRWITSGGDKEAVSGARDQIIQAAIGAILIVVVLSIIVILETLVFRQQVCFGLSCPVTIGALVTQ